VFRWRLRHQAGGEIDAVNVFHVVGNIASTAYVEGVAVLASKVAEAAELDALKFHHVTLKYCDSTLYLQIRANWRLLSR
jgi:hypothetical protein